MPHLLGEIVYFLYLLEEGGIDIALFYRHIPEHPHNISKLDILGAMGIAGIAQRAEPDKIGGENLFSHTQDYHTDDLPGIVALIDLRYGASSGTHPTGKTGLEVLSPWPLCYFIFEIGV